MYIVLSIFLSFLAVLLASFFTVVIERTQREESFLTGRSHCDHCRKTIAWYDNIPLFSFLLLGGRCRYCHKKIDRWFFFTELVAAIYALLLSLFLWQVDALATWPIWQMSLFFLTGLLLVFVVLADMRYLLIPDFFSGLLFIFGLIYQYFIFSTVGQGKEILFGKNILLALVFAFFFFFALAKIARFILKKDALGMGDIKLILPLALFLSWPKILVALFLSFIIGGIFATLLLVSKKKKLGQAVPFGPFLVTGAIVAFFYGEQLWQWYWQFLL